MTGILRAGLDALTKLLGAEPHQQDVVFSEASARAALAGPMTRRGLFKAAGAVAAGTLFADVLPAATDPLAGYEYRLTSYPLIMMSTPSHAATITLGNGIDIAEFELASAWRFSTGDGPGSVATVTSVDRSQGIITVSS